MSLSFKSHRALENFAIMNGWPWVRLQYKFIGHQRATSQPRVMYILCCLTEQLVLTANCSKSWDIHIDLSCKDALIANSVITPIMFDSFKLKESQDKISRKLSGFGRIPKQNVYLFICLLTDILWWKRLFAKAVQAVLIYCPFSRCMPNFHS